MVPGRTGGFTSGDSRGMSLQPEPLGIRKGSIWSHIFCTCVKADSFSAITEQVTAAGLVPRRQREQQMGDTALLLIILCALACWTCCWQPPDSPQTSPSLQKLLGEGCGLALGLVPACTCPCALCGCWKDSATVLETPMLVFGSKVTRWSAAPSQGETRLTVATTRAWQSHSGLAGWASEDLG